MCRIKKKRMCGFLTQSSAILLSFVMVDSIALADKITFKSGKAMDCIVLEYSQGLLTIADENGKVKTGNIGAIEHIDFTSGETMSASNGTNSETSLASQLQGDDLIAWKLARQAVKDKLKAEARLKTRLNQPALRQMALQGVSGEKKDPISSTQKEVKAIATHRFMRRTQTGDRKFVIPVKHTTVVRAEDKIKSKKIKWAQYEVYVTDYGSELRVESVKEEDKE